jgi:hypothetical protein
MRCFGRMIDLKFLTKLTVIANNFLSEPFTFVIKIQRP